MTFTEQQENWIASTFAKILRGKMDHTNVKGSFWLKAAELQTVFGDNYRAATDLLFIETDSRYYPPTEWSKGVCKAYQPTKAFYRIIDELLDKPAAPRKLKVGVVYYAEKVNIAKLDHVIADETYCHNIEDRMSARLYRKACDADGINMVSYRRTSGAKGRRFASSISLQGLPGYIRRYIMEDVTDIDMVNAHPTIILSLMAKADEDADMYHMNEYISNREGVLAQLMDYYKVDRKAAKTLMIMINYGASLSYSEDAMRGWLTDSRATLTIVDNKLVHHPFLVAYKEELVHAKKTLLALPEAKDFNIANDNRGLALFIQSIEDEILSICEGWCDYNGRTVSCLLFDGFHVEGTVTEGEISRLERCIDAFLKSKYEIHAGLKLSQKYYGVN
jgi:hypothetical protein